jgi:hypothetical protein
MAARDAVAAALGTPGAPAARAAQAAVAAAAGRARLESAWASKLIAVDVVQRVWYAKVRHDA